MARAAKYWYRGKSKSAYVGTYETVKGEREFRLTPVNGVGKTKVFDSPQSQSLVDAGWRQWKK